MRKVAGEWDTLKVTHYTGIGTEIREEFADSAAETKVVVPMPQGLGRYGIESASDPGTGARTFEWYLKNHLSSTMLVYGTGGGTSGGLKAAYDYRSFGEQIDLTKRNDKVTENFTGKEKDDETELNYFGARYLDPMLGMWTSVDPARQFASPYLYVGNGVNPMNGVDSDGKDFDGTGLYVAERMSWGVSKTNDARVLRAMNDPDRLFRFAEDCSGDSYIRLSSDPDPDYKKTYDVYVSGVADDEFSVITQILVGHELDHPYEFANPGHNALESVYSERDYYDGIKRMSEETKPDPIYKHDYDSAKEFGVYDE
jgi:RHS repeat-associated protein